MYFIDFNDIFKREVLINKGFSLGKLQKIRILLAL